MASRDRRPDPQLENAADTYNSFGNIKMLRAWGSGVCARCVEQQQQPVGIQYRYMPVCPVCPVCVPAPPGVFLPVVPCVPCVSRSPRCLFTGSSVITKPQVGMDALSSSISRSSRELQRPTRGI